MDMDREDRDRVKCICEGVRRGLPLVVVEPFPHQIEELLRVLRCQEQSYQAAKGHASASR